MSPHLKNLNFFLKQHRISLSFLSKASGLSVSVLNNVLAGRSNTIDHYLQIAAALNVSLDILLGTQDIFYNTDTLRRVDGLIHQVLKRNNFVGLWISAYLLLQQNAISSVNEGHTDAAILLQLDGILQTLDTYTYTTDPLYTPNKKLEYS